MTDRLKKTALDWTLQHTEAVKRIKDKLKSLPCLIVNISTFKIVETDASDKVYGGILKQRINDKEQLVRFTFGIWNATQEKCSSVKKRNTSNRSVNNKISRRPLKPKIPSKNRL